uniref:Kinesin motor domain-containing protein n=2 Tax=Palpitomonas bilix TaxID=652834 RepID=A0A7S3D2I0_9EUKA
MNVRVVVRPRPNSDSSDSIEHQFNSVTDCVDGMAMSEVGDVSKSLKFERVYPVNAVQEDVFFECVFPLVQRLFVGEDGAVVVMGQPSSGRMYSLLGTSTQPGVIPLSINAVLAMANELQRDGEEYAVRCALASVQDEVISDLFRSESLPRLKEDGSGRIVIRGLSELAVVQPAPFVDMMRRRVGKRKNALHTHLYFRLGVVRKYAEEGGQQKGEGSAAEHVSCLHFFLLADASARLHRLPRSQAGRSGKSNLPEPQRVPPNDPPAPEWLETFDNALKGMEEGAPVIRIHQSKPVLLLRDILKGTYPAVFFATATSSAKDLHRTVRTLSLATRIRQLGLAPDVSVDEVEEREVEENKRSRGGKSARTPNRDRGDTAEKASSHSAFLREKTLNEDIEAHRGRMAAGKEKEREKEMGVNKKDREKALSVEVDFLRQQLKRCLKERREAHDVNEVLQDEVDDLKVRNEFLTSEKKSFKSKIKSLEEDNRALLEENETLRSALERAQTASGSVKKGMAEEIAELEQQNASLAQRLRKSTDEARLQRAKAEREERKGEELEATVRKLEASVRALVEAVAKEKQKAKAAEEAHATPTPSRTKGTGMPQLAADIDQLWPHEEARNVMKQ